MKISTALNHRNRFLQRVKDIFLRARCYGLSYEKILMIYQKEINNTPQWKLLPVWAKEYIRGFRDAILGEIESRDIVWKLYLNGKYVDRKDVLDGQWIDVKGGCHFWIKTEKPYGKPQLD